MTLNLPEAYRLSELEEVVGTLYSITATDIGLIAVVGKISVRLPYELEVKLKDSIGRKMAILRLDGYHVRSLDEAQV